MTQLTASFRALHRDGLLVLPNAWDAGSALLLESAGALAIATTSAAMSWSHGVPDGERLAPSALVAAAQRIVRAVRVPVSVDVEMGYSPEPAKVGELLSALFDAGVVGINLEDGKESPSVLAAKIEVARQTAQRAGVDVFINARTDVFLKSLVAPEQRVGEVASRAALYRDSGCDGLFVPKLVDPTDIACVVSATPLPLNLLAVPGLPMPDALRAMGVRRLSVGQSLYQVAMGAARSACQTLLRRGEYEPLFSGVPFAELDALVRARASSA